MALLKSFIPPQQFELVRERIGEILADELEHQFVLSRELAGNYPYNPKVWVERSVSWDKTEGPSLNVTLSRGDYDNGNPRSVDGTYTYWVDIRTNAKFKEDGRGDRRAMLHVQRIAGMVRAILMNPAYMTLGFARPSISHVRVTTIAAADTSDQQDATSEARARVEVSVRVAEGVELKTAPELMGTDTKVKLFNTEKGYLYATRNTMRRMISEDGAQLLAEDGTPLAPEAVQDLITEVGEPIKTENLQQITTE